MLQWNLTSLSACQGKALSASVFIEPGPQFAIPQFGANSYYNENNVQKTNPVFRSNNDVSFRNKVETIKKGLSRNG